MNEWKEQEVILNEYLIEKELGRGGMGRVWLVKSNSTGRRFAVKQALIRDEKHRKAFLTELQTWIDLPEHPNIVPCRFFRTVGDEIVIFADFIEGGSLAGWIAKGKLTTVEQILDVAIQFAWGLHVIHERGLIHQDVKPGNVLMTPDGVPMVTDFGLARARMRASDGSFVSPALPPGQQSVLVSSGGMTPAYASPEQRNYNPLSRKTDIWSWGVSVLDMFMGGVSCPHGGHIAADVLDACMHSRNTDGDLPTISESVGDILRKCFARDPFARWSDMMAAANRMSECANYQMPQRKKSPTPVAAAIDGVPSSEFDRVTPTGGRWGSPKIWLTRALKATGRDPDDADEIIGRKAATHKGQLALDLAVFVEAQTLFDRLIAACPSNTDLYLELAALHSSKALLLEASSDYEGSLIDYSRAIALFEKVAVRDNSNTVLYGLASTCANKANSARMVGRLEESSSLYDRAIDLCEPLCRQKHCKAFLPFLLMVYMNKAITLSDLGDKGAGVLFCDKVIAICGGVNAESVKARLANDYARACIYKADVLACNGSIEESLTLFDRAIFTREKLLEQTGGNELAADLAVAHVSKANALYRSSKKQECLLPYDRAIRIYEQLAQCVPSDVESTLAMTYINKANALSDVGNCIEAIRLYELAIGTYERYVDREGRTDLLGQLAWGRLSRAAALLKMGKLDASEREKANVAFSHLISESQRPGNKDAQSLVVWARRALAPALDGIAAETSSILRLSTGTKIMLSRHAIVDLSDVNTWPRCPSGHFWFCTPNLSISPPPYSAQDEIVMDNMSAPVPATCQDAMEFVRVLVLDPKLGFYWRGDWMNSFSETYPLTAAEKKDWSRWVEQSMPFLKDVALFAATQADLAARLGERCISAGPVVPCHSVQARLCDGQNGVESVHLRHNGRLYSLNEMMNRRHRLVSSIRQMDYETAVDIVASSLRKDGGRIVSVERNRNAPCSIIVETSSGTVGIKVVVVRAPDEPTFTTRDASSLKAFCKGKTRRCAIAPVGLMPSGERSQDGHEGFYVKYQGFVGV